MCAFPMHVKIWRDQSDSSKYASSEVAFLHDITSSDFVFYGSERQPQIDA